STGSFIGAAGTNMYFNSYLAPASSVVTDGTTDLDGSTIAGVYNVQGGTFIRHDVQFTGDLESLGAYLTVSGDFNGHANLSPSSGPNPLTISALTVGPTT